MLKLLVKNVLNDLNSNLESVSSMIRTKIKSALHTSQPGETIKVCGWVRTRRDSKSGFSFVELNDGSCMANLQIVLDQNVPNYEKLIKDLTTGSSLSVTGKVIESPGKNQRIELQCRGFRSIRFCRCRNVSATEKASQFRIFERNCSFASTHKYFWSNYQSQK